MFNDLVIWVWFPSIHMEKNSMIVEANHFNTSTYIKFLFRNLNEKKIDCALFFIVSPRGKTVGVVSAQDLFVLCQHQIFMRDNINLCNFIRYSMQL